MEKKNFVVMLASLSGVRRLEIPVQAHTMSVDHGDLIFEIRGVENGSTYRSASEIYAKGTWKNAKMVN